MLKAMIERDLRLLEENYVKLKAQEQRLSDALAQAHVEVDKQQGRIEYARALLERVQAEEEQPPMSSRQNGNVEMPAEALADG